MTASDLIVLLQNLEAKDGDLEVFILTEKGDLPVQDVRVSVSLSAPGQRPQLPNYFVIVG